MEITKELQRWAYHALQGYGFRTTVKGLVKAGIDLQDATRFVQELHQNKETNMGTTVLAKVYTGSGRPSQFEVVPDEDRDEIDRLVEGYQFVIVAKGTDVADAGEAWDRYTYDDADRMCQWRR